jgi:hypothetical protein
MKNTEIVLLQKPYFFLMGHEFQDYLLSVGILLMLTAIKIQK